MPSAIRSVLEDRGFKIPSHQAAPATEVAFHLISYCMDPSTSLILISAFLVDRGGLWHDQVYVMLYAIEEVARTFLQPAAANSLKRGSKKLISDAFLESVEINEEKISVVDFSRS